eukprot:TRINITY_DN4477_c1_g4_i1.p1 TRINITY_DN4477_c1_g4~~TRINITY_DN4477_c1_g4_i1.p1  ORF type:complete len:1271 (+),score=262.51 TRINITY_DN4477_c1_g4_i1:2895-6707(+)
MRIPAVTPLYEDTILVKLWHNNWFSADELLAQGLISFSELRNNSLPPRWFNLYGWDPNEIPDVSAISASGVEPDANYFRGRMLISGRVDRLEQDDTLEPAKSLPARAIVEPALMQKALFADVYMVNGADGRNCRVELSFGCNSASTEPVSYDRESVASKMSDMGKDEEEDEGDGQEKDIVVEETVNTFTFSEKTGRINPILMMTPEDEQCQPFVMISVYTSSMIGKEARVGYAKRMLKDFPEYDPGNPSKPRFIALDTMPDQARTRNPPSVLMTIEIHHADDVVRHSRKQIKPMVYIVRAYCFMARHIKYEGMRQDVEPSNYGLRVACAGMSQTTKMLPGPRPTWMKPINLKVILCSDSTKEPPTIEPITLTLSEAGTFFNGDIGKAVAVYTHMRQKDSVGKWEPFELRPQWIKLYGGTYSNKPVAEVLVCFDLLLWKNRDDAKLQPREMWPQPEDMYDKSEHFSCLKKATLHFSLHGLRDLQPLPRTAYMGSSTVTNPVVIVEVQSFSEDDNGVDEFGKPRQLKFMYRPVIPGGDERVKAECLRKWNTTCNGSSCSNFEFLQVGTLNVEIPDTMLLRPYLRIKVMEEPADLPLVGKVGEPTLVGESLQSLAELLPCCWFDGVSLDKPFKDQMHLIKERLRESHNASKVRDRFRQPTDAELRELLKEYRTQAKDERDQALRAKTHHAVKVEEETPQPLDSTALPLQLRSAAPELRRPMPMNIKDVNMQTEESFVPPAGEPIQEVGAENTRKSVYGKLENSRKSPFVHDFWYKNVPLLRNQDIVNRNDEDIDWNYQPGQTFGFVKCTFKLTDGWIEQKPVGEDEEDVEEEDDDESSGDEAIVDSAEMDVERLRSSFEFDRDLDRYAFKEKKLIKKFKGPQNVPSRVRVRIYLVKAICVYSKSSGFADPYLDFQLGRNISVSMRNMVQFSTNTPEFYRVEERDIMLPEDSRLEIRMMDMEQLGLSDTVIGCTVLDLEDRWHSSKWRNKSDRQIVPVENRSLFCTDVIGKNRGSLEMWVEMIESVKASDQKPSDLRRPPDTEIDIRFVIWGASNVKAVAGDNTYTNVKIGMSLDCQEYLGDCPRQQETDVHFNSTDGKAIFNWRMVYPRIKMPPKSATVMVKLYHYELMGDTLIGTFDMDIKRHLEKVATKLDALTIGPNDLRFKPLEASGDKEGESKADAQDEEEDIGSVNMTMYIMTSVEAQGRPAGRGREEPNDDPQLITPIEGRDWGSYLATFGFAWPDFGLWKKLIPIFVAMVIFLASVVAMKNMGLL